MALNEIENDRILRITQHHDMTLWHNDVPNLARKQYRQRYSLNNRFSGNFFYGKSTIGTTKAAIEVNNEKFPLSILLVTYLHLDTLEQLQGSKLQLLHNLSFLVSLHNSNLQLLVFSSELLECTVWLPFLDGI